MASTVIVKIQKPLASNHPGDDWLLYAQNHLGMATIPSSEVPQNIKDAMEFVNKTYWWGVFENDSWTILNQADTQGW